MHLFQISHLFTYIIRLAVVTYHSDIFVKFCMGYQQWRSQEFEVGGAKIESEARIEGEARDLAGGGVWGGGLVSPSPENFRKLVLKIVQSGV